MGECYIDPKEMFKDDGEFLVYDPDFSNTIGFLTTEKGWKVSKIYIVEKLRQKLTRKFRDEYWTENDGEPVKLLNKYVKKLDKLIQKQLKWFLRLNTSDDSFYKESPIWSDIERDFIYYVLKCELYNEWNRIDGIIEEAAEEYDNALSRLDDEEWADSYYWEWICHAIEYPDETEEQWAERLKANKEANERFAEMFRKWANEHTEEITKPAR